MDNQIWFRRLLPSTSPGNIGKCFWEPDFSAKYLCNNSFETIDDYGDFFAETKENIKNSSINRGKYESQRYFIKARLFCAKNKF